MSLLEPGLQGILLLIHAFILVSRYGAIINPFPLESGCEDYSFLEEAVADFEKGLDSILTDSVETPELCALFEEPDVVTSLVPSGFVHFDSTNSDTSKLQLAPSIIFCKL